MSTTTKIVITEDVAETMRLASLGPKWAGSAYTDAEEAYRTAPERSEEEAAAELARDAIEARQEAGEADYAARWKANCERIAAACGYDATVLLTSEHHRGTHTDDLDGNDWVEREIWQQAHDETALPEGW